MPTPSYVNALNKLKEADPELKAAMVSNLTTAAIASIGQKYNLGQNNVFLLSRLIGWFILDLITSGEFIAELKNVGVKPDDFESLKKDLVEKVFGPHQSVLDRVGIDYKAILTAKPITFPSPPPAQPVSPPQTPPPSAPAPSPQKMEPIPRPGAGMAAPTPPAGAPAKSLGAEGLTTVPQGPPRVTFPGMPPATPPQPPEKAEAPAFGKATPPFREVRFPTPPKIEEVPKIITPRSPQATGVPAPTPPAGAPAKSLGAEGLGKPIQPGPRPPEKPFDPFNSVQGRPEPYRTGGEAKARPFDSTQGREVIDLTTFQIGPKPPTEEKKSMPTPEPPKPDNVLDLRQNNK